MIEIQIGPIVGHVDSHSARVMMQLESRAHVEARLQKVDSPGSRRATANATDGRPFILHFEDLDEDSLYDLVFSAPEELWPEDREVVRVRTPPLNPSSVSVAVVSCNRSKRPDQAPLYEDLWYRLHGELVGRNTDHSVVLHIGDQVYCDDIYAACTHLLEIDSTSSEFREACGLLYRSVYHNAWGAGRAINAIFRSFPNLMIWDDHDIVDDWGRHAEQRGKDRADYQVGLIARDAFRGYQRSLGPERHQLLGDNSEGFWVRHGRLGVVTLDVRSSRSFEYDPKQPMLGRKQWKFLKEVVLADQEVDTLVVASPVPFVLFDHKTTTKTVRRMDLAEMVGWKNVRGIDDIYDQWFTPSHTRELFELFDCLRHWRDGTERKREVVLVGGDAHVGMDADIYYEGSKLFRYLVSSPIAGDPESVLLLGFLAAHHSTRRRLADTAYEIEVSTLSGTRNFAVIEAESGKMLDGRILLWLRSALTTIRCVEPSSDERSTHCVPLTRRSRSEAAPGRLTRARGSSAGSQWPAARRSGTWMSGCRRLELLASNWSAIDV